MSVGWGAARWDPVTDSSETPDTTAETPDTSTTLAVIPPDPIDLEEAGLPELAAEANRWHAKAENSARSALESAWHSGQALLAAKAQCNHGTWLPWLAANFSGSKTTAQAYMRIASNTQRVALLNPEQSLREAVKALCKSHREPSPEPALTIESFLRRLDTLGDNALALAADVVGGSLSITPDRAQSAGDSILAALARIDDLYGQLESIARMAHAL